jgi:hypothetical protein
MRSQSQGQGAQAKTAPAYDLRLAVTPQPSSKRREEAREEVERWAKARWRRGWSRHVAVPACKVDTVISILSILCDTRIYQAPLSLSRQRSFARHPAQDTSKQDIRHQGRSTIATPPSLHSLLLRAFHHCDTLPARLSPTSNRYICTCSPS